MTTDSSSQDAQQWKTKYYDQLDRLDEKEKEWSALESVLKRAIGRLSLAAEGSNAELDRQLRDIRTVVKDKVNRHRLELVLDDVSKLLAKLEEKQSSPDRQAVDTLLAVVDKLQLPTHVEKAQKKLIKKLAKASDSDSEALLTATVELLTSAIEQQPETNEKKPGLLSRLIGLGDTPESATEVEALAPVLVHVLKLLPWPEALADSVQQLIRATQQSSSDEDLAGNISQLETLVNEWKQHSVSDNRVADIPDSSASTVSAEANAISELELYRRCLISILEKINSTESPMGHISALQVVARDARSHDELDSLTQDLAGLYQQISGNQASHADAAMMASEQPSIQELLIRLLEQLIVPAEFEDQVAEMKQRLEDETTAENWKPLLKDVAVLINSIRSHMQQEKQEFENFLQQVTGRLSEMDEFLRHEQVAITDAEQQGQTFDAEVKTHVQNIHDDMQKAEDLEALKHHVQHRLDAMSEHIKQYRKNENQRFSEAQQSVQTMQSRMQSLEQETANLKHLIAEKNRQAMFDVLTEIPNRLAYEKRVAEEIARWQRFGHPLSLVVWDVDLFKQVNDTYGHKAGDKVLRTIAQLLNGRIRETDFLARYGGEEFVMLLPGTKEEETLRLVNELRLKVEECGFHYHGKKVTITVSCGVSSFRVEDTLAQVFERADKALYRAKENGRNQCVVASCRSD